jgi:hypothetical protein
VLRRIHRLTRPAETQCGSWNRDRSCSTKKHFLFNKKTMLASPRRRGERYELEADRGAATRCIWNSHLEGRRPRAPAASCNQRGLRSPESWADRAGPIQTRIEFEPASWTRSGQACFGVGGSRW